MARLVDEWYETWSIWHEIMGSIYDLKDENIFYSLVGALV